MMICITTTGCMKEKIENRKITNNAMDYFEPSNIGDCVLLDNLLFSPYTVKESLKTQVNFSTKNVLEDVQIKDFSNQVFIFRNGWGFNSLEAQNRIASNLFRNSNDKTLVIIGQSDLYKSAASDYLQENGFRGIASNIFTEAESNYPSEPIGLPKFPPKFEQYILFEK